jgi:hypothetical protein
MLGEAERLKSSGSSYRTRRLSKDGLKLNDPPSCGIGEVVVEETDEPRLCSLPCAEPGTGVDIVDM